MELDQWGSVCKHMNNGDPIFLDCVIVLNRPASPTPNVLLAMSMASQSFRLCMGNCLTKKILSSLPVDSRRPHNLSPVDASLSWLNTTYKVMGPYLVSVSCKRANIY